MVNSNVKLSYKQAVSKDYPHLSKDKHLFNMTISLTNYVWDHKQCLVKLTRHCLSNYGPMFVSQ